MFPLIQERVAMNPHFWKILGLLACLAPFAGCYGKKERRNEAANSRPANVADEATVNLKISVDKSDLVNHPQTLRLDHKYHFLAQLDLNGTEAQLIPTVLTIALRTGASNSESDWTIQTADDLHSEIHLPIIQGKVNELAQFSSRAFQPGVYQARIYHHTMDLFDDNKQTQFKLLGKTTITLIEAEIPQERR